MPAPIADPPKCDVPGCGMLADARTDGTEVDAQGLGRPSLPKINYCARHPNWSHSNDAAIFATTDAYRKRA
jgi:hypothetical protein